MSSARIAPLVVNHQGQFPSVTITYNSRPTCTIEDVTDAIEQAVAEMHLPDTSMPNSPAT